MSAAKKLSLATELVDINEASAEKLRESLPGIGEVLSQRIVAYRREHGPFEDSHELLDIPGVSRASVTKLASLISTAPPSASQSGLRSLSPNSQAPGDAALYTGHTVPLFSIPVDVLRGPQAPTMASLLPSGPVETLRPYAEPPPSSSVMPVLGAALSPEVVPLKAPATRAAEDDELSVPVDRAYRIWLVAAGMVFLSGTVGAIFGIRSQEGGPRSMLERRVGGVQDATAELKSAVGSLETQSTAFASSISALDARLASQERKTSSLASPAAPTKKTPDPKAPKAPDEVRQALRDFDKLTAK